MRKLLLTLFLLLGMLSSYAQSNISVFSTNPTNAYIDGETLTWSVMVTNNGPMPAANVRAFYQLPAFLTPIPTGIQKFWWTGSNGSSGMNFDLENIIPILAVNQTVIYTINIKVPDGYTGTIDNLVVTYDHRADIEVVNTDNKTTYVPGTQSVYTVTVKNNGPEVANKVNVLNAIPAGITNFSWTGSNGTSGTNANLVDTILVLGVGQVVTYTITLDVPAGFTGPLTSTASASFVGIDPVPGCTKCVDVDTSALNADIVVVNTDGQFVYTPGANSVYTVTVTNNGPAVATNVVVSNAIPAGITAFSWTGSNGSTGTNVALANTIPSLAVGQTITYTITLGVPLTYNNPAITSQTIVTADNPDPNPGCPACIDTDVNPLTATDVVVVNTNGQTTYTAGGTSVYTVTVTNTGLNPALNVHVTNAVPAGITTFTWTGSNGSSGTGALNNTIPSLAPGASVTYTITLQVPAAYEGDLVSTTVMTSDNDSDPTCSQCVDIDTDPTPHADVFITNTDNTDIYTPGSNSVYTVTVTNNGPQAAANVVVANAIPAGVTAFSWVGSNGSSGTNTALNNTIPSLAMGATVTYTITLGVPAGQTGTLTSTATATSVTPDPVTTNNSASDIDNNVASADLVVVKTLNQGTNYTAGLDAIYTITVKNQGPTAAQNVSVTDAIPTGLAPATATWSGSNGTNGTGNLTDVIASLPVGETVTYTLKIPVPSNFSPTANIVNQVVVTSTTPDPNPACPDCTHTATPKPLANLVTLKTNGQTTYIANQQVIYTITVTNPGPSDAHNVLVKDNKPFNIELMEWNGNNTGGAGSLNNIISVLPAGASIQYTVKMFVPANHPSYVGPLINTAVVTSDTPDPVPACPGCTDTDTPKVDFVTVTRNQYTIPELVNDVLVNLDCVGITNVTAQAGDFFGNFGVQYFESNNSNFPIKDGIIIRNGNADFSQGKYTGNNLSSEASNMGDAQLTAISQAQGNTGPIRDVSYLQFDFVPIANNMSFDFLFASNEYGTYQCGFADVFAFILTNITAGTPPVNIAIVPGSAPPVPISVLTIRNSTYNGGCSSVNPNLFAQFNTIPNSANSAINMIGQTVVMKASSAVIPGNTYRIKLAVGDYNDTAFDTAVFIAAGSFDIGQPKLPDDLTLANGGAVCPGGEYLLQAATGSTSNFILRWKKDGVIVLDQAGVPVSTPTLTVTEPGVYTIMAAFASDPTCFLSDDIRIEYRPEIEIAEPNDLVLCGVPTQPIAFNLRNNDAVILSTLPEPDFYEVFYYHSVEDIENGVSAISGPTNYMGTNGETIAAAVIGYDNDCFTIKTFQLIIQDCNVVMQPHTAHVCEPAPYDGEEVFDLTTYIPLMAPTLDPTEYTFTFYNSEADALAADNEIVDPTTYVGTSEVVWVRAQNNLIAAASAVKPLTLIVTSQPDLADVANVEACSTEGYQLPVLTAGNYYTGPGGSGTQIPFDTLITTSQTIYIYQVEGTAPYTCTDETSFEITIYNSPVVDKPANVEVCGSFVLEPLNVGQYYTQPGGAGVVVPAGTEITATQTFYIYAQTGAGVILCTDEHAYTVTINDSPVVSPATPLEACADNEDNFAYFDLSPAGAEILNGQTGLTLTYHLSQIAAEFGTTPITDDITNYYTTVPTIWASVIQSGTTTNCRSVVAIQLIVHPKPLAPVVTKYNLCDYNNSPDGVEVFDLTTRDTQVTGGNAGYIASYYLTKENAEQGVSPITPANAYTNTTLHNQTIWARVETPFGCVNVASFQLIVDPLPVVNPNLDTFYACEDVPGEGEFNLDNMVDDITGGAAGYAVTFYETLAQAQLGGTDNETGIYLSTSKTIYARLTDVVTGCFTTTPVVLEVIPAPIAAVPAPLEICDANNDGYGVYNLDPVIQSIQNALGNVLVTVHETALDAEFNTNKIPNTSNYDNSVLQIQTLYIRVQSDQTVCYDVVELKLIANPTPVIVTPSPYALCDDGASDSDGRAIFNLTIKKSEVLGTLDPTLYSVSYYLTLADAQAGTPVIGNPLTYLSASGEVYIKVSNNTTGCFKIVPLKLIVNPLPTAVQPIAPYRLCDVTAPLKDGIEVFDLETVIPAIIGAQQGLVVTFHHSYADAQGNTGAIATPNAYPSGPAVETLFVRVTVEATGCYRIVLQDLKVEPLPIILAPTQDMLTVCDTDGNGIGEFNLEDLIQGMKNGEPNIVITFHHSILDAQNGNNPIGNTTEYINSDPYLEYIYVRVVNTVTGCVNQEVYRLSLVVEPAPQAPALTPLVLCDTDANNQDLKTYFDLTQKDADIYQALNVPVGSLTIHYFINEASANAGAPRITTPAHYLGTDGQVIWVRVESIANNCFSLSSFVLKVNKPLALTTPSVLAICNEALPNDGQAVFDLTVKNNEILGPLGIGKGYTVTYYETDPKVTTPPAVAIATPTAYTNPAPPAGNPKTLYVVVTSKEGCKSYTTLTIKVLPLPMPDTTPDALVKCNEDNSTDGKEEFDLTEAEADIRNNDNQSIVTYYILQSDAEAGTNKIPDPTAYVSGNGSVWVRMEANTNNPNDPKCYQVVELKLVVNPLPAIGDANGKVPAYAICEANTDGIAEFDLNSHIEAILGANAATDYDIEFYLDQTALDAGTALPRLYTNATPNSQTILVVVTHKGTGCKITKSLDLLVEESAIANPIVNTTTPLFECDDDGVNDGFHEFDLTVVEAEVLGAQNPTDYKVTYHLSEADANDNTQPQGLNPVTSPTTFINTIKDGQRIWVRVTNMSTISKCHDITFFDIEVEQLPEPKLEEGTICVDKITDEVLRTYEITTGLDATHTFEWKKGGVVIAGETGPSLVVDAPGIYSVIAKSANGCESTEVSTEVFQSGPAAKVGVGYYVSNAFSDVQTITVEVEGYGVYQYKLDEGPWQDSPIFTDVSRGEHKVTVRDTKTANPCDDLVIEGASVIDYPNFFTPNGDGFHDTWNIVGLQGTGAVIYIFDRYGKLMKQVSPDENGGWDGTFNGQPVPATDYWFTVTYPETVGDTVVNKEFKAHFSLKR